MSILRMGTAVNICFVLGFENVIKVSQVGRSQISFGGLKQDRIMWALSRKGILEIAETAYD